MGKNKDLSKDMTSKNVELQGWIQDHQHEALWERDSCWYSFLEIE